MEPSNPNRYFVEDVIYCLLCKLTKYDPEAMYTSNGDAVCQECQEWIVNHQEDIYESKD